jgi:hypothetical protein
MDFKILKSAAISAVVFALITLSPHFFWGGFSNEYGSGLYWVYIVLTIVSFLSAPITGFLSVYLFKREKGSLTYKVLLSLIAILALANALLSALLPFILRLFDRYSYYSPAEYIQEYSLMIAFSLLIGFIFSFLGCAFGAILGASAFSEKEEKHRMHLGKILFVTLGVLAVFVFIILFFMFAPQRNDGYIVTTGFVKIQPLTPSVWYGGRNFSASFTNALGTTIRINGITLNETIAGSNCYPLDDLAGTSVKAGGTFTLKSSGCPVKADGESYDMIVSIQYNATMGGITTNRTDAGHIKGEAESP